MKYIFIFVLLISALFISSASAAAFDGIICWTDTVSHYNNNENAEYLFTYDIQTGNLFYEPFNGYIIKGGVPGESFYCIREENNANEHYIPMLSPDFGFGPTTYTALAPDVKWNSFTLCEAKLEEGNNITISDIAYYENKGNIRYVIGYIDGILYCYDKYEKIVALYPDGSIIEYEWKPYTSRIDRIEINDEKIYNPVFSDSDLERIEGYEDWEVFFLTEYSDEYLYKNKWYTFHCLSAEDTPAIIVEYNDATSSVLNLNINEEYNLVRYFDIEICDSKLYLYAMSADRKLYLFTHDMKTRNTDSLEINRADTLSEDNHMEVFPDQNMLLCYYTGPNNEEVMSFQPVFYLVDMNTGDTITLMKDEDFDIENFGKLTLNDITEVVVLCTSQVQ